MLPAFNLNLNTQEEHPLLRELLLIILTSNPIALFLCTLALLNLDNRWCNRDLSLDFLWVFLAGTCLSYLTLAIIRHLLVLVKEGKKPSTWPLKVFPLLALACFIWGAVGAIDALIFYIHGVC